MSNQEEIHAGKTGKRVRCSKHGTCLIDCVSKCNLAELERDLFNALKYCRPALMKNDPSAKWVDEVIADAEKRLNRP